MVRRKEGKVSAREYRERKKQLAEALGRHADYLKQEAERKRLAYRSRRTLTVDELSWKRQKGRLAAQRFRDRKKAGMYFLNHLFLMIETSQHCKIAVT